MKETTLGGRLESVLLLLVCGLAATAAVAQDKKADTPKPAQSIAELRQQLEKILQDTHTPGASIAIVRRDGPEWVAGLGKSNIAANQAATDQTLFRIGSTSKAFASLSILKLASEGKLSLEDPIRKLIPEVWFENPWEATDPVRVADLLEHTTGWDDWNAREYAKDGKGMTLREGLDYDHHSRISRWRPGTRMAYCNSGPPVAAYIVEKITGQRFEDYVTQNFFLPIGMKTATYFEQPSPQLTTLYLDGKTPSPYWNILERPAGSINASAQDMAAYVQFYLDRGAVGTQVVVPASFIDRMETPTRTWAAQQGLKAGYGLSNYTSVHDGFVYQGHNGSVNGGLTEMAYLARQGVGYFYSTNSGNGAAFDRIGNAIRAYITRSLTKPEASARAPLPADAQEYAGWYEPASPRGQSFYFLERFWLERVHFQHGDLIITDLGGRNPQTFVPVGGEQFRYLPKKGPAEPIATAVLLSPNAEGRFVNGGQTWRRVPTWLVVTELGFGLCFCLAVALIVLYAPFWISVGLIKKRRRPAERSIRLWPLIAVLSLSASLFLFAAAWKNVLPRLGRPTFWSVGLFLTTLGFGLATSASAFVLWSSRKQAIRRSVRWFSIFVTSALLIAAAYLAWWGVLGMRTWA